MGLLVARITQAPPPLAVPDSIDLPAGTTPEAVTLARDWVLVLAEGEILLFDRAIGRRCPTGSRCPDSFILPQIFMLVHQPYAQQRH